MSLEVIDLISSSDPTTPVRAVYNDQSLRGQRQKTGSTGLGRTQISSAEVPHVASDLEYGWSSDGFDLLKESETAFAESIGAKRRRLSPPTNANQYLGLQSTIKTPVQHETKQIRSLNLRRDGSETIILNSSPEDSRLPGPSPTIPTKANGLNSDRFITNAIDTTLAPSSDLFCSSPKVRLNDVVDEMATDEMMAASSDPFASSPHVAKKMAPTQRPNPQANMALPSCVGSTKATSTRQREVEPISSSAPVEKSLFESSPPANTRTHKQSRPAVISIDSSSDKESVSSDDELPDLKDFDALKPRPRSHTSIRRTQSEVISTQRHPQSRAKASKLVVRKEGQQTKEAKAAAKEADKEKKRQEREAAKAAKVREKERASALAEANKLRTDKKISTPEMIVLLPEGLNATLQTQTETLLRELGVQHDMWESPVQNVVKWRRKVRSRFNDDMGLWEPIPLDITEEKHILVVLTASEIVSMTLDESLEEHATKMEQCFPGCQVIYLLQGMTPWFRKNRTIRNRQFASNVRAHEAQPPPTATTSGRRRNAAPPAEYIPEETIEDALLQLQITHDFLIHHTINPLETAQWITIFTQHISTVPYRKQRDQATRTAGFCMESGQVKTGEDKDDTYVRMLQEIVRVTAPIAYGVAGEFGTVSELVKGLEGGGPLRLEAVRKYANKDGALSDRTIGQAVSRRLYKVFTGTDETSTDV